MILPAPGRTAVRAVALGVVVALLLPTSLPVRAQNSAMVAARSVAERSRRETGDQQPGLVVLGVFELFELTLKSTMVSSSLGLAGPTPDSLDELVEQANGWRFVPQGVPRSHPLAPVLGLVAPETSRMLGTARDYRCVAVRRVREGEQLGDYQYWLVEGLLPDPQKASLGERTMARQLFADGKTGRKMLLLAADEGGRFFDRDAEGMIRQYALRVPLDGSAEALMPLAQLALPQRLRQVLLQLQQDMQHDVQAENTTVSYFRDAKVGQRSCFRIRIDHPQPGERHAFARLELFIDVEQRIPIRLETYDWPPDGEVEPQLREEVSYLHLRGDVGLAEAQFSPEDF